MVAPLLQSTLSCDDCACRVRVGCYFGGIKLIPRNTPRPPNRRWAIAWRCHDISTALVSMKRGQPSLGVRAVAKPGQATSIFPVKLVQDVRAAEEVCNIALLPHWQAC